MFIKDCSTGPSVAEGIADEIYNDKDDFTYVHCEPDGDYLLGYDPDLYILRCCWTTKPCNEVLDYRLFNYDLSSYNQPTSGSWNRCDPEHVGYRL